MKRLSSLLLAVLLCVCLLCALVPAAHGREGLGLDIPFTKEALLSALYEADITTIRQAIDLKLISCEELTAYYLERIEAYNQPYNCFITLCDNALDIARQRDEALAAGSVPGLLFGIPVVVKDNMHYEGYYTTNGWDYEDSAVSDYNAYVVERLLEEGAVIIAKANMSLEAQSARESTSIAVGETKNAYDPLLVSGGSSGGSAVSVSLNLCVASLGSDTNASLRIPAVLNGCISLRPTFGMIPMDGIYPLNTTRDTPGAITRTVQDQAIMLDVLTDGSYSFSDNLDANALDGLRLGILEELLNEDDPATDPSILAVFSNAAEELKACGAEVVTVSIPDLFALSDATLETNRQSYKDDLYDAFTSLLAEYELDAVIYPTCTSAPVRSGTDENGTFWDAYDQDFLNNCYVLPPSAQVPAIAIPIGYHRLGSGIGMEIVADKNCEQLLLDIAYSYTLRYDHREVPAGAPDDYIDANTGSLSQLLSAYFAAKDAAAAPTIVPVTAPTDPTMAPSAAPTTEPATEPTATPSVGDSGDDAENDGNEIRPTVCIWAVAICAAVLICVLLPAAVIRKKRRKEHENALR